MSDSPRADIPGEAIIPVAEVMPAQQTHSVLTPGVIAGVLKDFESWLEKASAAEIEIKPPFGESIDLQTLLGQFLALKQEINLQTRAVRSQQEQNADTLLNLSRAVDLLKEKADAVSKPAPASDEILRPVLKTLVDIYDALTLASREVIRVQENVLPVLEMLQNESEPTLLTEVPEQKPLSFWSRWFSSGPRTEIPLPQKIPGPLPRHLEVARRSQQMLASLLAGYTMSLQRIDRALQQQGLEAIATVGKPFDPEQMEVLETVSDSNRTAGEVVDEVRRGYLWKGRLFRYAQVRVARS